MTIFKQKTGLVTHDETNDQNRELDKLYSQV